MASIDPLCRYCSGFLLALTGPEGIRQVGVWRDWTYGWVQNSKCPLCRLLKRAIALNNHWSYTHNWADKEPIRLEWDSTLAPGCRGTIRILHCEGPWIAFGQPLDRGQSVTDHTYLRPQLDGEIQIPHIKKWLTQCDEIHKNCVLTPRDTHITALAGLQVLRLIDVDSNCLHETTDCPPYVALSYVWGSVPTLKLTKASRPKLIRPNAITKIERWLPRTVNDAILLVRRLGFRYLWVDSLCLLQNDPADLQRGVEAMDRIYEMAHLTIIAACGHDANAGLPGLRPGTRDEQPQLLDVQKDVYLGIYFDVDRLMQKSYYQTRAWTFQERLLSRRTLYFVDNKVFFRCQVAEHCETCFDHPQPRRRGYNISNPLPAALNRKDVEGYGTLITHYSRCVMTNENDVLRAFAGLTRRFAQNLGYPIFQGLPTGIFDVAVLFRGKGLRRRVGFPSYSWAGWIGHIDNQPMNHVELNKWLEKETWIIWHEITAKGVHSPIWDPAPTAVFGGPGNRSYPRRLARESPFVELGFSITPTAPREIVPPSGLDPFPSYPLLQFWTVSCLFGIGSIDVTRPVGTLVTRGDEICGAVFLDGFEQTSFFELDGSSYEVALLSKCRNPWPLVGGAYKYGSALNPGDDYYNVMLLEWDNGVAERRGIGSIRTKAITMGFEPGPVWKEILLA